MTRPDLNLNQIQLKFPCPKQWDDLEGDDCQRFCQECHLNVRNLSAMPRREAEAYLQSQPGRVCVVFRRRPDGSIVAADDPVASRPALRARIPGRLAQAAGVLLFSLGLTLPGCRRDAQIGDSCTESEGNQSSCQEADVDALAELGGYWDEVGYFDNGVDPPAPAADAPPASGE